MHEELFHCVYQILIPFEADHQREFEFILFYLAIKSNTRG